MSSHIRPKRSPLLSVSARLGLPLLLAVFGVLALNFALASPQQTALAHEVTVDGDAADWVMSATNQVNLGHVVRDAAYRGEYVWNDAAGDERTDFADPDPNVDLTGFRVTADRDNLYFSAAISDVITATGAGAPQIRVAIDTDLVTDSGEVSLGGSAETSATVTATWEYLLVTPFGSASSTTSETILYQGGLTTQTLTGTATISTATDVLELSVPWAALGMSAPPTLPLRFTVAAFRAYTDDTTLDVSGSSDALDAVTNYGDPGATSNTSVEVSDGVVDYYFDLFFEPDGDVYAPLVVSEVLYDPSGSEPEAEFVEIYNVSPIAIDLTLYKVGDEETIGDAEGMERFPDSTIAPDGVVVLANNADSFVSTYGFLPDYAINAGSQTVSTTSNYNTWATSNVQLANGGDEVILLDGSDTAVDVVEWDDSSPDWTGLVNTDFAVSNGESMERAPADRDTNDVARDFRAQPNDGTPGQVVHHIDLSIVKGANPPRPAPGETITYTLAFSNTGAYTATGIVITDVIPVSVSVQSVISSGVEITQTVTGGYTYTWDVTDLVQNDGGVITITGVLSAALPAGHIFTNSAAITTTAGVTMTVDPDAANDSDAVGIEVSYADLTMAKTADPEPVVAGTALTYTVLITNQGNVSATNVVLSDTLPPSATLQTLDQTDDSQAEFDAGTHDNTHWINPRPQPYVHSDEWLEIDDTLLATGVFTSRVFDASNVVSWADLAWRPRRPTWKPLPDNGGAEEYYALGEANMAGNRVLLHGDALVGSTVTDTSGFANHGACPATVSETCPTASLAGRFNGALAFDGVLSQTVVVTDAHDPARYALELWIWVPTGSVTDTSFILRTDTPTDTAENYSHLLGILDGHFQHTVYDGGYRTITSTTPVTPDMWHHVVGTAQSGGDLELYVDGEREAQMGGIGTLWTGGDWYRLGSTYGPTGTSQYLSGRLDEVAVYSRTLSSGEVLDHYLRGALRLSFEVRSCDDASCSGESWSGAYSEQSNTGTELPSVTFSPALAANRYFQYRATLETDDADHTPALRRVHVEPDHRAVYADQGSCSTELHAFICDLGDLSAGQVVTVEAHANVHPSALGTITNTAHVTAAGDITPTTATATSTVGSEVDINIQKYDDDDPDGDGYLEWHYGMADPVNPGSPMTYTLQVHNGGPSTAWDVVITDTLPITVTGVAAQGGWASCDFATRTITCTADSLTRHTWPHLVVTGTAPTSLGWITNTAWITAEASAVYTTSHLSDTQSTLITPLADLTIVKTAHPDPVDPGETLTFTVAVTNTGPSTATLVVVTDTLQTGLTGYASGTGWSCSPVGNDIVCSLSSDLNPSDSASFNITTTAPVSGLIGNVATVASGTYDPDYDNNTAYAYAAVLPVANLHISKTDTLDPVGAAAPLTYTLTISNSGYVDAGAREANLALINDHNVHIPWGGRAWPYPSSIYLSSVEGTVRDITVTLNSLNHTYPADVEALLVGPGGQSVVLMANAGGGADVDATLTFHDSGHTMPVSGTLTSTVTYRPTNYGLTGDLPEPAPAGPYGGGLSVFNGASPNGWWRLYVYDTFGSDDGDIAGGWGLTLTTRTTDTVTLSDTLPSGLTGVSVDAPTGWAQIGSDPLTYEADTLPVQTQAVFTITASAPITGGVITNTAAITSTTADFWPASNEDTITTTITAQADLGITKQVTPAVVNPEAPLTYTLSITNAGPSPMQTATVTDTLPDGLSDVSASGCDLSALPVMTCTLSSLDVSAASYVTITASAPITPGVITNTASVTATVSDPITADNTALVTVTVRPQADLEVVKTVEPPVVKPNGILTYTVAVTNHGPLDTTIITVTDVITGAAGLNVYDTTSGWSCVEADPVITCTHPGTFTSGEEATIWLTGTAPSFSGVVTNTATITGAEPADHRPLNNTYVLTTLVSSPPTITVPLEDYTTDEDVARVITFTVGDPDTPLAGLNLTAAVADTTLIPPGNVAFGGVGVDRTATITPAVDLYGASQITITVTDDVGLSDSDVLTLTVTPVNDAPEFTSAQVEYATVGEVYTYNITADDVDIGDVLTITAPISPTWLSLTRTSTRTALLSGTPAEADLGDHLVSLLVRDSGGLTDTQIFTITVVRGMYYIYLPLVAKNYAVAPDLVVDSLVATGDTVTVTISNQGDAPVTRTFENEFWVDVYVDPDTRPTTVNQIWAQVGSQGLVWGVTQDALPLDPGETLVLTTSRDHDGAYFWPQESVITWTLPAGTEIWAQVDSAHEDTDYGAVMENHEIISAPYAEGGNILGPVFSTGSIVGGASSPTTSGWQPPEGSHLPPRPQVDNSSRHQERLRR